ncbi:MAG: hypothetical protein JXO49_03530 [Deltaproteobacteria bacterium]|nr:hypothetical protein [Candidatus Anaeroferrophillus wilburensis]MBN2888399.1 hypothetical protein [Deltaproteobacteria bacterium]
MCMKIEFTCQCSSEKAQFNNMNNILPPSVIENVYCPSCSSKVAVNSETMLVDNGWIIEYDMPQIQYLLAKVGIPESQITPEFVFDERYSTWQGVTPTDMEQSIREREKMLEIAKVDKRRYAETLKEWSITRMKNFMEAGWRKAQPTAG